MSTWTTLQARDSSPFVYNEGDEGNSSSTDGSDSAIEVLDAVPSEKPAARTKLTIRLPARVNKPAPSRPSPHPLPTDRESPQTPRRATPDPLSVEGILGCTEFDDSPTTPSWRPQPLPTISPVRRHAKRRALSRSTSPPVLLDDPDNPFQHVVFPDAAPPSPPPPKRRRGRPPKPKPVRPASPVEEPVSCIDMWVYVKYPPREEVVLKGRKRQSKLVTPPAAMHGSVKLTTDVSYDEFISLVESAVEGLNVHEAVGSIGFYFMKNNRRSGVEFPLTNEKQFPTMINKIKNLAPRDRDATDLVITICAQKSKKKKVAARGRGHDDDLDEDDELEPVNDLNRLIGNAAQNIDSALRPFVHTLEAKFPVGGCKDHPDIACYVYPRGTGGPLHFHLDDNRLRVWALAIVRPSPTHSVYHV
ncbi:hypothetical protein FB107DRAFT_280869 [Schizophyllum commune]